MITFGPQQRYYLYREPTDMRTTKPTTADYRRHLSATRPALHHQVGEGGALRFPRTGLDWHPGGCRPRAAGVLLRKGLGGIVLPSPLLSPSWLSSTPSSSD